MYNCVREVITLEEAERVAAFLVSQDSFDARLTPGELMQAQNHPRESLGEENSHYWYVENEHGKVIAVNGVRENEHKNGGYVGTFLAVLREYRQEGIASGLFEVMLTCIKGKGARYLFIDTSDRNEYQAIRYFLKKRGFQEVGYFPHYYYEGEGTYWYYKRLV